MKKILVMAFALHTVSSTVFADDKDQAPRDPAPLKGRYALYAGELGEKTAPTRNDRKLAIEITGQAAKDMFESMYPDYHPTCSNERGDRDRRKGQLYCAYSVQVGYRCFLGYDLRSGKTIAGASC